MLDLGERSYPVCLLDTNAASVMVKDDTMMRHFLEWVFDGATMVPLFSPFTLMELRRSPSVFDQFIERFESLPCGMTKGYVDLLIEERDSYPHPLSANLVSVAFLPSPLGGDGNRLRNLPWMMDQHAEILQAWKDVAPDILEGMRSLVNNYPPESGSSYTPKEVGHFIWLAVFQQLKLHDCTAGFVRATIDDGQAVDTNAFPSLKAMMFTAFYKLYVDPSRKPYDSDVGDILISSALPYVEVFVTENHQAESLRKVRQRDGFMQDLEVLRLRDFRSGPPPRPR